MSDNAVKLATIAVGLLLIGTALAGCTITPHLTESPSTTKTSPAKSHNTPPAPTPERSSPTPQATISAQQADYEAAIAVWPEPLPPGYAWPAWIDLPHLDPYGLGQLGEADNASGIYRCILIDAAWYAYFEANDPVASKDYAIRADKYVIPDNPSIFPVTENGVIIDGDLASANGICRGIAGDLSK